ncbi:MAG: hypothetical protein ACOCZQ_01220 [Nanoarchaeota archaeon]
MGILTLDSVNFAVKGTSIIEIVVPSFLVFILIFYALIESHLLKKKYSIITAFAITALVVFPHFFDVFGPCWNLFEIIYNALKEISILIVAGIIMYVFLAIFGIKMNKMKEYSYLIFSVILVTFTTLIVYTRPEECINHVTNLIVIVGVAFLLNLMLIMGKKRSLNRKTK